MMHNANLIGSIVAGVALVTVIGTASAAKECYAPDSLAQRRAFSRAVTTEGGKAIWLGGQTGAPNLDFEGQVRQIFSELDKNIKAVGGRGLEDMVTMTVFITDVPEALPFLTANTSLDLLRRAAASVEDMAVVVLL